MKSGSKSKGGLTKRLELVARFAQRHHELTRLNYPAVEAEEEAARSEYEQLREEAKLAVQRRDEAKEHLAQLRERLRSLKPKYAKAKSLSEKARHQALEARCDTLRRVPQPHREALGLLVLDATLARVKAADTLREALEDVGVSPGVSIPPEREHEWIEAHGDLRVRLLGWWIGKLKKLPFTRLQDEIIEFARRH